MCTWCFWPRCAWCYAYIFLCLRHCGISAMSSTSRSTVCPLKNTEKNPKYVWIQTSPINIALFSLLWHETKTFVLSFQLIHAVLSLSPSLALRRVSRPWSSISWALKMVNNIFFWNAALLLCFSLLPVFTACVSLARIWLALSLTSAAEMTLAWN